MTEKNYKPEIRFKGFSDEWEVKKLDRIFNKIRNAFVGTASPYYVDEGHFYLESNNVKDGQINRNSEIFINDEFYEKQKDNWLHTGDMVMVQSGHVGHSAVIPPELNNTAAHALIIFADPKEKICSFFLNFQFQTTQIKKEIGTITTGNTIKHILSSEMKKFDVLLPEYNEQSKLGTYYSHLNHLITLHQQKYNKLGSIKKSMLEKMFPQNGALVPEIRFKGFTGDWEVRKYCDTFIKIPNNTLSRAELNYNSGLAKNVHYGDILIKFGELLDVEKDEIPYVTDDSLANKFKSTKLQNGDVIIADAAEDEMVGKCTELINVGEETVISGLHTIPSRPIFAFASGYLGYFMNSPAYHTQLLRLMQGTKVLSISKSVLQDTTIFYPIKNVEQSKIGAFFKHLDHLLTLEQRDLEKLKNIKKACLEKMFV